MTTIDFSAWKLSRGALARSTVAAIVLSSPIALVWWLAGETRALTVWLGLVAMVVAAMRLSFSRQLVTGLVVGTGAGLGTLTGGNTVGLLLLLVVSCLAQRGFNRWSISSGAMIPPLVFAYGTEAALPPLEVALGTWLGAGLAIAIVSLAGLRGSSRPADSDQALAHAIALAVGCAGLVILIVTLNLPNGFWGVLCLCLVFRPTLVETSAYARQRVFGTGVGAVAAVLLGTLGPTTVVVLFALLSGILAIAYTLANDYFRYVACLTCVLLFTFSVRQPVLDLAAQRIGMTVLGSVLAMGLITLLTRSETPETAEPAR